MIPSGVYEPLRYLMLPIKEIDAALPSRGRIIDLGCGQGIIASYLAKAKGRTVIGVDLNNKRIPAVKSKNLSFKHSDIRNYQITSRDNLLISDVLHHLNKNDQIKLIKNMSKIKKGNYLIIKEIDTQEFVRSRLSRFWDFVFYPKDKINYFSSNGLKELLEKNGFLVKFKRTTRLFPGSTTLFICRKK